MSGSVGVKDEAGRDELLAQLLGELTEQQRTGRQPDIDTLASQHPVVADELRELWAAAQIAEQFAHQGSRSRSTVELAARRVCPRACPFKLTFATRVWRL